MMRMVRMWYTLKEERENMVETAFPEGFKTVELILLTPVVQTTPGDVDQNQTFRTGIATSLNPPIALAIHQIDTNIAIAGGVMGNASNTFQEVVALTENLNETNATTAENDPRTLFTDTREYTGSLSTNGAAAVIEPNVMFRKLDPPLWTIAQELNFVALLVIAAGTALNVNLKLRIHYTLHTIDQRMTTQLLQRINLTQQP